ncbi:hypothetical protein K437DRAFT_49514 [Tilletiaria anomala UBC 951]|uniref:Zn(2)-C6 fungal-type domain-containing protein n=1 Tax=Tilletiaria anomala (strain ATCC 24038 / CBS 436.72 / UBC 951) TaxID=1037660 RepID=A0A066V8T4_TILAU|nr:uncharacterized protein K437DRAFT_49514 [Tilletiaria anomala UBC 951]KDN36703.1 hypothetical protein K437DRAFT_49514 [Tilletiaria anomala UBC 951]
MSGASGDFSHLEDTAAAEAAIAAAAVAAAGLSQHQHQQNGNGHSHVQHGKQQQEQPRSRSGREDIVSPPPPPTAEEALVAEQQQQETSERQQQHAQGSGSQSYDPHFGHAQQHHPEVNSHVPLPGTPAHAAHAALQGTPSLNGTEGGPLSSTPVHDHSFGQSFQQHPHHHDQSISHSHGGGGGAAADTSLQLSESIGRHLGPGRACGRCRERKLRCDGERPLCGQCAKVRRTFETKSLKTGKPLDEESWKGLCVYSDNPVRRSASKRKDKDGAPTLLGPNGTPLKRTKKDSQGGKGAADYTAGLQLIADAAHGVAKDGRGTNLQGGDSIGGANGHVGTYGLPLRSADASTSFGPRHSGDGVPPPPPGAGGQEDAQGRLFRSIMDSAAASAAAPLQAHTLFQQQQAGPGGYGFHAAATAGPVTRIVPNVNSHSLVEKNLQRMLPPPDLLVRHVQLFFDTFPFMHVVQPARFVGRVVEGVDSERFPAAALLHAMLAWVYTFQPGDAQPWDAHAAALMGYDTGFFTFISPAAIGLSTPNSTAPSSADGSGSDRVSTLAQAVAENPAARHASFAKQGVWASFSGWRLDVCNASIVLGQWLYATANLPDSWMQAGLSLRACVPIALHKSRKPAPEDAVVGASGGGAGGGSGASAGLPGPSSGYNVYGSIAIRPDPGAGGSSSATTAHASSSSSNGSPRRSVNLNVPAALGLHPPKDWIEEEERRRTFWIALASDRTSSSTTGWACSFAEEDVLVELPSASQEEFAAGDPNVPPPGSEQLVSDQMIDDVDLFTEKFVDGLGLYIKACVLIGRVGRQLLRLPTKPLESEYRRIFSSGIEQDVDRYDESMRNFIQHSNHATIMGAMTAELATTAQLMVQVCRLLMYEPLIPFDNAAVAKTDEACTQAVGIIVNYISLRHPPVYSWCVAQVARTIIRQMEAGECRSREPHTHNPNEMAEKRALHDRLQVCL